MTWRRGKISHGSQHPTRVVTHLVILQRDRADPDILRPAVLESPEDVLEDTELGREELASSAAGSFDEALDCDASQISVKARTRRRK